VDRALVKNLVVGYVGADGARRAEILRIIATVLDFSQEERTRWEKVVVMVTDGDGDGWWCHGGDGVGVGGVNGEWW
jgi:hypothetical protein